MVRSTFSNFQLYRTVLLTRVTLDPQNLHFLQLKFVPFDLYHPVFPLSSPWVKWSEVKWYSLSRVRLFATHGLYSPWNSPGQNTGVGSLFLLQGIFPTQGSNPGLPHCHYFILFLLFCFYFFLQCIHAL